MIRETPDVFDAGLFRRGMAPQSAKVLQLDAARRKVQTELQELLQQRNEASRAVGEKKRAGENADDLIKQVQALKDSIGKLEARERQIGEELEDLLANLPNLPGPDVPDGADEYDNVEVRRHGEPTRFEFAAREHFDLG